MTSFKVIEQARSGQVRFMVPQMAFPPAQPVFFSLPLLISFLGGPATFGRLDYASALSGVLLKSFFVKSFLFLPLGDSCSIACSKEGLSHSFYAS